jgi:hypothetical protein
MNLIRFAMFGTYFATAAFSGATAQTLSVLPTPGAPASALSQKETTVDVLARINPEREAKRPEEVLRECTNNEKCNAVLDEIGAYYGVPKGSAKVVMKIVPVNADGEMTFYDVDVPEGYKYCNYTLKTVSINPPTGDRASFIELQSTDQGVKVATWTPRGQFGQGRSWVDAYLVVRGAREDLIEGMRASHACQRPDPTKVTCRGDYSKSQVNHGQPGCGTITTDMANLPALPQ